MVKEAHEKAGTSAHWSMYEIAYGGPDGTFVALSADNSMADIDTGFAENKKFMEAMGADGMKEMRTLYASAIDSSSSELFSINPKREYPQDDWVKGDPDFSEAEAGNGGQTGSCGQAGCGEETVVVFMFMWSRGSHHPQTARMNGAPSGVWGGMFGSAESTLPR